MDELVLMASQHYEERDKQNGIIDKRSVLECEQDGGIVDQCKINCVLKETARSVLECEQDSERIETMELMNCY